MVPRQARESAIPVGGHTARSESRTVVVDPQEQPEQPGQRCDGSGRSLGGVASGQPVDLVLEGGGVKGIGLVGAVAGLEEAGYRAVRVAGSSAGAIVGALLAAGLPVDELEPRMRSLDLRRFRDPTPLTRVPVAGRWLSLLLRRGLYEGVALRDWLDGELDALGVRTFGDLRLTGDEAGALPPERAYRLVVMAADLSLGRLVQLPWDYQRLYGLDPDEQPVADAVRASAAIPYYFRPVVLRRPDGHDSVLVDGGLLSNFPVDVFDQPRSARPRWPTFGIKLSARPTAAPRPRSIAGPLDHVRALVDTLLTATDRMHLDDPCVVARTMFVDTLAVAATDFDLDDATKDVLYRNGREAAARFLARWDEVAYLQQCRGEVG
jgi:NTE family protein